MKMLLRILPLLLLMTVGCNAQNKEQSDFIPKGYTVLKKYFGDLNNDGQDDCVLIIKKIDKRNVVTNRFGETVDRNKRGIIVLFKNQTGYELAVKNYDCFLSENEDGGVYYPAELWIKFLKGNLIVHFAHGRYGFWNYTFRFQDSHFKLIGYDSDSHRGPIVNSETSINFLTKKKLFRENTNGDVEGGDEVFKETWTTIEVENLIKLSEIKSFAALDKHDF